MESSPTTDFVHYHPLPKSKLSATIARMYLTAPNTLLSSSPCKPTFAPYYLPISKLDSNVDLTTLFYTVSVQLLTLFLYTPISNSLLWPVGSLNSTFVFCTHQCFCFFLQNSLSSPYYLPSPHLGGMLLHVLSILTNMDFLSILVRSKCGKIFEM